MARIAMPLAKDFEDSEFRIPYDRLREAGHQVTLIGKQASETVEGKQKQEKATIDCTAADVRAQEFDAMVIPGGYSPDQLRTDEAIVRLVRDFAELDRPIAAVCHGPQLLIEAEAVRGKTMTSWPSVRKDLENAGAKWVDQEVCRDGQLITSRKPDDLEAFSKAILQQLQ